MLRIDVLGTWQLVSYSAHDGHGGPISYPLGPDALGLIMYTADGYMSAQLMRRRRPSFDRPDTAGGTTEQEAAAASGYLAYSGPFEVDEHANILYHHVTVSLLPNWLDHREIRQGHLDGDHLTLTGTTTCADGSSTVATLVWKRAT